MNIDKEIEKLMAKLEPKDKAKVNEFHSKIKDIAKNGGNINEVIKDIENYADNK